jgi:D-glycero-D-manno-heptose 1,7-bisphosphate phosphatase
MARRFVMLDRDGTVIKECHYLSDPAQVELLPGVGEGLRQLQEMGLGLVLLTNQSGIHRGYFGWEEVERVHQVLRALLEAEGVELEGIFVCPHRPEEACGCRKPEPGLAHQAAQELEFDPKAGFLIGDKACDIDVGKRVGAQTFLVRTGYGAQLEAEGDIRPDYVIDDVRGAVPVIAEQMGAE